MAGLLANIIAFYLLPAYAVDYDKLLRITVAGPHRNLPNFPIKYSYLSRQNTPYIYYSIVISTIIQNREFIKCFLIIFYRKFANPICLIASYTPTATEFDKFKHLILSSFNMGIRTIRSLFKSKMFSAIPFVSFPKIRKQSS